MFQFRMYVFFNAYIMIGCLCYFLLMSAFLLDLPVTPWRLAGFGDFRKKTAVFGCLTNAQLLRQLR